MPPFRERVTDNAKKEQLMASLDQIRRITIHATWTAIAAGATDQEQLAAGQEKIAATSHAMAARRTHLGHRAQRRPVVRSAQPSISSVAMLTATLNREKRIRMRGWRKVRSTRRRPITTLEQRYRIHTAVANENTEAVGSSRMS